MGLVYRSARWCLDPRLCLAKMSSNFCEELLHIYIATIASTPATFAVQHSVQCSKAWPYTRNSEPGTKTLRLKPWAKLLLSRTEIFAILYMSPPSPASKLFNVLTCASTVNRQEYRFVLAGDCFSLTLSSSERTQPLMLRVLGSRLSRDRNGLFRGFKASTSMKGCMATFPIS